ncbi:MAG: hypothetical protein IJY04_02345 [Clostridia bacterium]|nr:hypothetical protein [Clostridia bacterium]
MNFKNLLAILLCSITICAALSFDISASENSNAADKNTATSESELKTEKPDSGHVIHILNSITDISEQRDSVSAPILCFDVSEDGRIACGFTSGGKNSILVFDNELEFLYGYEIRYGSVFYVRWKENSELLQIYFPEAEIIISLSPTLDTTESAKVVREPENPDAIDRLFRLTEVTRGDSIYCLSAPIDKDGIRMYEKLTVTKLGEDEKIIFDASAIGRISDTVTLICIGIFSVFCLYFLATEAFYLISKKRKDMNPHEAEL